LAAPHVLGGKMEEHTLKKRKKWLPSILFALIFLIGLTLASYPFFSDWYNRRLQEELIIEYDHAVAAASPEALEAEREAARVYNESLLGDMVLRDPFDPEAFMETTAEYEERLNMAGNGVMGYIEIPKINVNLVIFHGTSMEVLDKGTGHLENTSLPVGGTGTHAVLSAHTAYAKASLFNDLIKLNEGDLFILTVLDEKLAYEANQIKVVEPVDTSDLYIDLQEDYVTLVTCTPYGVNSHRLLVRGTRVPYAEEAVAQIQQEPNNRRLYLIIVAAVLLTVIVTITVKKMRKQWRERNEA